MDAYKSKMIRKLLSSTRLDTNEAMLVEQFTNQRTAVLEEMETREANLLLVHLQDIRDMKCKKMRAKVAHLLGVYGMTDAAGKLDWLRINKFIMNIGSRNPRRKKLYNLDPQELKAVLNQVELMVKKDIATQAAR